MRPAPGSPGQAPWLLRLRRFRAQRAGMLGLGLLALVALFALLAWPAARLLGTDPYAADLFSRYGPASAAHPLGTDEAGRDELVRLMLGGQVSLLVGLLATLLGGLIGTLVGVVAGTAGGALDGALMRATDGVIALPLLPVLIVLGAVDLTKLGASPEFARSPAAGFWRIVVVLGLVDWTGMARVARAAALELRERDFVVAARASGAGTARIIRAHVLPNAATPMVVAATLTVGRVILLESVLSFLGFGIVPPVPSWGNMLNDAQELVTEAPLLAVLPGLLIFATVIAVNLVGDGLQAALDPRSE